MENVAPVRLEEEVGLFLVQVAQPRIFHDIGREDGPPAPFDGFLGGYGLATHEVVQAHDGPRNLGPYHSLRVLTDA